MRSLLASFIFLSSLCAEEVEPDPYEGLTPLQAAVEHMLSERESKEALDKAIEAARKQGASEQAILEARFIFHVDRREDDILASMAPEFVARRDDFKLAESEIFGLREDWLAVVEYVQSIAALKDNDQAAFKKHITEAFWLSPRQGVAFAPHIERLRLDEAMKKVKIDFTRSFHTLTGDSVTLASLTEGKKALLLHFWSPWSRECEASINDFIVSEKELAANNIVVVSVIGETTPEAVTDTDAIFSTIGKKPPGTWIRDTEKASLSRQLRIQNVPMMVLIGLDGKVLFNGHPAEKRLWEALGGIAPGITRPPVDDGH
ncbi:thioredoxin-like domain-containing protein [Haloferula chungangensis]|uniref:Thioredoxin-like domain-containing protein n=1 Tax=Haloferula chungangensis TaxID=1048331 RepID=A0ABW2LAK9_9BACT